MRDPLSSFSEVTDQERRWVPDWYSWLLDVAGSIGVLQTDVSTLQAWGTPILVTDLGAGTTGQRAFVSDATASTFASVVTGGGSTLVPVYYDGTDWRIG